MTRPGPRNAITDVAGIRVGHAERLDGGYLTGVTVVLAPDRGAVTAVDVRGGGPATRETAALDPVRFEQRAAAVVLTGGSAFGLAAADGVVAHLATGDRVPLVPAAAVYDLGRGGRFDARPDADLGRRAVLAAAAGPVRQGSVGAGAGAVTAEMKGGVGTASTVLAGGSVLGAIAVVNAHGSVLDPGTGLPWAAGLGAPDEFPLRVPDPDEHAAARRALADPGRPRAGLDLPNTVIGVVATDAVLDPVAARRLAEAAQDGLARAVNPVHGPTDGDVVFGIGTADGPVVALGELLAAASATFARAVVHGVLAATSVTTPFGHLASYRELYPRATAGIVPDP